MENITAASEEPNSPAEHEPDDSVEGMNVEEQEKNKINEAEKGEDESNSNEKDKQNSTIHMEEADKQMIDLEEKRRKNCLGNMEKIEKEFADLKEKFFAEKIDGLEKEYENIKNGIHQGFIKKCKELEAEKEHKVWAAQKWREYQLKNIENVFEAEKRQAEDEFKHEQKFLKEKMMEIALEKKKKLEEDRSTMNLMGDVTDKSAKRALRPKRSKEQKDAQTYKRRLNPPHINYSLKESEISEDLILIQKTSANHPLGKFERGRTNDVYTDKGKLCYHNQVFEKGKEVVIEAKHESGKWQGILVSINPAEIHVKSPDNTKSRFSISQLRNGRYTIIALG